MRESRLDATLAVALHRAAAYLQSAIADQLPDSSRGENLIVEVAEDTMRMKIADRASYEAERGEAGAAPRPVIGNILRASAHDLIQTITQSCGG